jgi:hypothetical protein
MTLRPPDPGTRQAALDRRFTESLEWARWAVSCWSSFPVEREPRPTVLVGPRTLVAQGFRTSEAKLAFSEGRIMAGVPIPDRVLLELAPRREISGGRQRELPTLRITEAARAETDFRTDRGPRRLPAWRLTVQDTLGPIWVLDPEIEPAEWRRSEPAPTARPQLEPPGQDPGARVDLAADQRTLTLHFIGAPPEDEQYPHAEVIESMQAVSIVPAGRDVGQAAFRRAIGHMHQITVCLRQPLGARVVVDLHGNPAQVLATAPAGRQ